ncbi:MAG: nitroreductase family protein [Tannerellaceae bacterium]|jgi:nitroreductase|nr:nitroreductase family protein [Tannerellaceae bacterium]
MNLLDIIRKRCSIRNYSKSPVEESKINYILEAARLSPSACNNQPWRFILAQGSDTIRKIIESYPREWAKTAPLFIIICGDHTQSWKRPSDGKDHIDIDAGIACAQICLAATEVKLGTCIICHFNAPLIKSSLNLPDNIEPLIIISIGYPSEATLFETTPKKRKAMEEILIRL